MTPVEGLRTQHRELVELAAELEASLGEPVSAARISQARCQLSTFLGKLLVHDVAERRSLYPALSGHEREAARRLAARFGSAMGGLLARFQGLSQAWGEAEMRTRTPAFRTELAELLARLRERIEQEDAELYPAVEAEPSFATASIP